MEWALIGVINIVKKNRAKNLMDATRSRYPVKGQSCQLRHQIFLELA